MGSRPIQSITGREPGNTMTQRRALPHGEYRLSELPDHVNVPSIPDDPRTVHTLFAVLLDDVDRSDMAQDLKADVIQGLIQAWTYHAREDGGADVTVDIHRHGLNTEVDRGDETLTR